MKNNAIRIGLAVAAAVAMAGATAALASASPIEAFVGTDKRSYASGEEIAVTLSLENTSLSEVITAEGFSEEPFYLNLTFYGSKGTKYTAYELGTTSTWHEPPPSRLFRALNQAGNEYTIPGRKVERLAFEWSQSFDPFPASRYYPPLEPDRYTLQLDYSALFVAPGDVRTATAADGTEVEYVKTGDGDAVTLVSTTATLCVQADNDGDLYFYPACEETQLEDCNDADSAVNPGAAETLYDGVDNDCNVATADVSASDYGTVIIEADMHKIGGDGTHPTSTKSMLGGLYVRLYDRSEGSCAKGYGTSWQHYEAIWTSSCIVQADGLTTTGGDSPGIITLSNVSPGEYLAVAKYADIYAGVNVGLLGAGETVYKHLHAMEKSNGKKVPAKSKKRSGSELLIIEPEYVEWDGTSELYPFVFDSVGDWEVTTSVVPPEGFVSDNDALSEIVLSEVEVVQFTITDVGSEWSSVGVVYDVKHEKKREKIKSKIGFKCSPKFQEKKNFDKFCQEKVKKDKGK